MGRDFTTIHPHVGLGRLKFGASSDEVRAYLGEPGVVVEAGESYTGWINFEYPYFGVTAYLDEAEQQRLIALAIENSDATLYGHRLMGLTRRAAEALAEEIDLGYSVPAVDALGVELEFHEIDLEMRFDANHLWLVSWSVKIDENDRIHWPA